MYVTFCLRNQMYSQYPLQSLYAGTFMDSFMTYVNSLELGAKYQIQTTFSWVTLLTEDITA